VSNVLPVLLLLLAGFLAGGAYASWKNSRLLALVLASAAALAVAASVLRSV
jgi:asparagine N-glycosylation enzyme membrane subunit Stt3